MPDIKQIAGDAVRLGFVAVVTTVYTGADLVITGRAALGDAAAYVKVCVGS